MAAIRKIRKIVTGTNQTDGAGVKLVRVIGKGDVLDFDPFLMLDAFDSTNPADYIKGFPWHPHRGMETVTYLISGSIEHSDSLGNKGTIQDGCCQWMTAGSGILHQEMPQAAKRMLGVQLWLNLPRNDKMAPPQYRDITPAMIPGVQEEGCTVGVIAGAYRDASGPVQGDYVKTQLLDVRLIPGGAFEVDTAQHATVFVYIIEGAGYFDDARQTRLAQHRAVLFEPGDRLVAQAAETGMRFLLFAGEPLGEPVAWGGPIVMNTRDELDQAFRELDQGTFIAKT